MKIVLMVLVVLVLDVVLYGKIIAREDKALASMAHCSNFHRSCKRQKRLLRKRYQKGQTVRFYRKHGRS
jgi:hypothetical protein